MNEQEQIKKLIKNLSITEEEAIQLMEDDKKIDKGAKMFELTPEQKKIAKKMTITTSATKVDAYGKKSARTKKTDNDKSTLIEKIANSIAELTEQIEITNPEREINFSFNGRKFKVILSAPRK